MKEAHKQEETLTSEISKLTGELEQIKTSLDAENKNLEAIPKEPDFSGNAEYQQILASIKEKQQELNSLDNGEEAKKQLSEQLSGKNRNWQQLIRKSEKPTIMFVSTNRSRSFRKARSSTHRAKLMHR